MYLSYSRNQKRKENKQSPSSLEASLHLGRNNPKDTCKYTVFQETTSVMENKKAE